MGYHTEELTLIAGQSVYTLSNPKPLKVYQAWYRNTTSNVDVPMRVITRDEYNRLGNKSSADGVGKTCSIPSSLRGS